MKTPSLRQAAKDLFVLIFIATVFGCVTTPRNPFLTGLAFHPYHLIAILMAARYGYVIAVGSSAVMIVLYVLGGMAQVEGGSIPSLLLYPHSIFASGLILIAVIAGNLFDQFQHSLAEGERLRKELADQNTVLKQNSQVLETANRELKSRIMEETSTFQTMYEMAEKLSTLEPMDLYPAILDILTQHLGVSKCSFYRIEDQLLRLTAEKGWSSVTDEEKEMPIDQGVMGRVVKDKKPITVKDLLCRNQLAKGEKIMAAPVLVQGTNDVMGVIAVEAMPFEKFTSQNVRAFCMVAEWASKAMNNVQVFCKTEKELKELDVKARADEQECQWMLNRILKQLEANEFHDASIQQITSLGAAVLPRIEEILLKLNTKLVTKRNALTVLERLLDQGHRLESSSCRAFTLESLRDWFRLEGYRQVALEPDNHTAGELLVVYIEELQNQLRVLIIRSIVLRLGRGAVVSPRMIEKIRQELPQVDPLVNELLSALESNDPKLIASVAEKRWGFARESFERTVGALIDGHDPWIKACAIHAAGIAGHVSHRTAIQTAFLDKNPVVREVALETLAKLDKVASDPHLKDLLRQRIASEPDRMVREMIQDCLAKTNPVVNAVTLSEGTGKKGSVRERLDEAAATVTVRDKSS